MKTLAPLFLLLIASVIPTFPQLPVFAGAIDHAGAGRKADLRLAPSATLVVTKTADTNDGVCNADCSLREAVAAAAPGDTITFASPLFDTAQTISINGQINLTKNLTINGRGPALTTIRNVAPQGTTSRVLVNVGNVVNLSGVTITGGNSSPTDFVNGCGALCGGGIYNSGTLTITNSVIADNAATSVGTSLTLGGGIFNMGTLTLTNCTVRGNTVNGTIGNKQGGGIFTQQGTTTLINSTVSGNTAIGGSTNSGAGVFVQSGTLRVVNSTLSGNSTIGGTANQGGGIYIFGGVVTVSNSTLTANSAGTGSFSRGGGIFAAGGTVSVRNSIVSGNSAAIAGANIQGTPTTSDSNIIGNEVSVKLAPLGNYGGPTQTHALLAGSSAVNAGNNCVLTANGCGDNNEAAVTDQRGRNRVGQVDIGAFELVSFTVTKTADSNDGVCDSDCSLREAVAAARSGDVIQFASPLFDTAQTVQVNGQIVIDKSLTIIGRGANLTTVQNIAAASATSRVFLINSGTTVNISGLTITGGNLTAGAETNGCGATLACGGGVHSSGDLTITDSVISGNTANSSTFTIGGGIYSNGGTLTIIGSTISDNRATCISAGIVLGGGIFIQTNTLTVINSTVSGNVLTNATNPQGGGGIRGNAGTVNLINSTISNNSANNSGGGVLKGDGTLNMVNTIIGGNFASSNPDLEGSPSASSTNNLIGGNAGLLPLGNYGGTTPTHAILPTSPAVNGGNNCVLTQTCTGVNPPDPLTTDQRGRLRDTQVDIGAFESPANLIVTNTNDSGAGSLRAAITTANSTADDEAITFNIPTSDSRCASGVCTITLTSGQLSIANNGWLTIGGTGAASLILSGNNASRVIQVQDNARVIISDLTVADGLEQSLCGGGIDMQVSVVALLNSLTVRNNRVTSDTACGSGGGISKRGFGELTILNSTIHDNAANINGGGINVTSQMNLVNSTVSGNRSNVTFATGGGGGIRNLGPVNVINSTITGNNGQNGAGISNNGGTYTVRNSIVANSTGLDCNNGGTITFSNSLVEDGSCGVTSGVNGNLTGDPALAPLGYYGGSSMTHALMSGSPALNAGNNCVTNRTCASNNPPIPLTIDQRGAARVGNVDIGAVEANSSANGGNFRGRLPDGLINSPYSFMLVPSNGTTTYAVTGGALPPGMNLTTAFAPNAVVSVTGTPTSGGIFNFTVTATNGPNTSVTDYSLNVFVPTAAGVSVSGRVMTSDGRGLRNATVTMTDASGVTRSARTGTFGYYRFEDVGSGQVMTFNVKAKRASFTPQVVYIGDSITDLDFVEGVF